MSVPLESWPPPALLELDDMEPAFAIDEMSADWLDDWSLVCEVPPAVSMDPPFSAASHVEQEVLPPAESLLEEPEEPEEAGAAAAVVEEAAEPSPHGRDSATGARIASSQRWKRMIKRI